MRKLGSLTVCVSRFLLGAMLGLLLCCVVYPVLSIVLWVRGLFGVFHYVQDARSKVSVEWRELVNVGIVQGQEWGGWCGENMLGSLITCVCAFVWPFLRKVSWYVALRSCVWAVCRERGDAILTL